MSESEFIRILTPGKIILSGEHAVVYGKPALAMAVDRFLQIEASRSSVANQITIELSQFNIKHSLCLTELMDCYSKLNENYQKFLLGELSINQVTESPVELLMYCVAAFFNLQPSVLDRQTLTQGIHLHLTSDIPLGCGMGSSAACIVGILTALSYLLDVKIESSDFYQLAHQIENLQHGRSSGIDIRLAQMGGALKFQSGNSTPLPIPQLDFILVNSGQPKSSTGDCVSFTKAYFTQEDHAEEFARVTEKFEQALLTHDSQGIHDCVQSNHRLLTKIGVVSPKVQQFISELTKMGATGKVCGAGSIKGDGCGILLVPYAPDNDQQINSINQLCSEYGYPLMKAQGFARGSHLVTKAEVN